MHSCAGNAVHVAIRVEADSLTVVSENFHGVY
jgi:hypothetical protein